MSERFNAGNELAHLYRNLVAECPKRILPLSFSTAIRYLHPRMGEAG